MAIDVTDFYGRATERAGKFSLTPTDKGAGGLEVKLRGSFLQRAAQWVREHVSERSQLPERRAAERQATLAFIGALRTRYGDTAAQAAMRKSGIRENKPLLSRNVRQAVRNLELQYRANLATISRNADVDHKGGLDFLRQMINNDWLASPALRAQLTEKQTGREPLQQGSLAAAIADAVIAEETPPPQAMKAVMSALVLAHENGEPRFMLEYLKTADLSEPHLKNFLSILTRVPFAKNEASQNLLELAALGFFETFPAHSVQLTGRGGATRLAYNMAAPPSDEISGAVAKDMTDRAMNSWRAFPPAAVEAHVDSKGTLNAAALLQEMPRNAQFTLDLERDLGTCEKYVVLGKDYARGKPEDVLQALWQAADAKPQRFARLANLMTQSASFALSDAVSKEGVSVMALGETAFASQTKQSYEVQKSPLGSLSVTRREQAQIQEGDDVALASFTSGSQHVRLGEDATASRLHEVEFVLRQDNTLDVGGALSRCAMDAPLASFVPLDTQH